MRTKLNSQSRTLVAPPSPLLVVLSGPSGAGKDAVLNQMKSQGFPLSYTVTETTRKMRLGEKDGIDYFFLTDARFQEMLDHGEFLEWARVYGCWYGVPKEQVRQALVQERDVIIKTDVQGAATIKRLAPDAVFIFLVPPTLKELEDRLRQRKTEAVFDLELRLRTAESELDRLPEFDYVVINRRDALKQAVSDIQSIITAEKCKVKPRRIKL